MSLAVSLAVPFAVSRRVSRPLLQGGTCKKPSGAASQPGRFGACRQQAGLATIRSRPGRRGLFAAGPGQAVGGVACSRGRPRGAVAACGWLLAGEGALCTTRARKDWAHGDNGDGRGGHAHRGGGTGDGRRNPKGA